MGLRKNTSAPAFESDDNENQGAAQRAAIEYAADAENEAEVTSTAPAASTDVTDVVVTDTNTDEADAAARTAAAARAEQPARTPIAESVSTALAAAPKRSLAAVMGSKFAPALEGYKDIIDARDVDFDSFPRVTVGLDGFSNDREDDLGKVIGIEVMSWNERFIVTAGDDSDAANALVKFSHDGINLDDGSGTCKDYVKVLKETHGYENADIKKYYNIYGQLCATSTDGKLTAVDAVEREIVSIQIPPRSVSKFKGHQINDGMKVSRGLLPESAFIQLSQEKVKGKARAFALINFSRLPAGIVEEEAVAA